MEENNILTNVSVLLEACKNGKVIKVFNNIYDKKDNIIIKKDTIIDKLEPLRKVIKNNIVGINALILDSYNSETSSKESREGFDGSISRVKDFKDRKLQAQEKFKAAKESIKKVIDDIRNKNGKFDYLSIEKTVEELVDFMIQNSKNPFSYLSKEIFSYDDYLYNHSTNVCTIGIAILKKLNESSQEQTQKNGLKLLQKQQRAETPMIIKYTNYEIGEIAKGFFMHDIGKVLIPCELLNKPSKFTAMEYEEVKKHSYINGLKLLRRNKINEPFISNSVMYHHGLSYPAEERCYPTHKKPSEIPAYVYVCKLADIYDALTSKRCYKEAISPLLVATNIFRHYANKGSKAFQRILLSFVDIIGIYPPNSVVYLKNGKKAYVIDSDGPIVIPFTNSKGDTIEKEEEPIKVLSSDIDEFSSNYTKELFSPIEIYKSLPKYLKKFYKELS